MDVIGEPVRTAQMSGAWSSTPSTVNSEAGTAVSGDIAGRMAILPTRASSSVRPSGGAARTARLAAPPESAVRLTIS